MSSLLIYIGSQLITIHFQIKLKNEDIPQDKQDTDTFAIRKNLTRLSEMRRYTSQKSK
jgi:hypothetical protein